MPDLTRGHNPLPLPPLGGRGGGQGGRGGKPFPSPLFIFFPLLIVEPLLGALFEQLLRIVFIYIILHKVIPMTKREHTVFGLVCLGCGKIHYVTERCKRSDSCSRCSALWTRNLYRQFFHRWRQIDDPGEVVLWTMGTSLMDTEANRTRISRYWTLFRMRMNKHGGWTPLFKVVEAGAKGRRLHVHLMVSGFLDHARVLKAWREVAGESANVNFSSVRSDNVNRHLSYLCKYLVKQRSTYSWLGPMYHASALKRGGVRCHDCGDDLQFLGETYMIMTGEVLREKDINIEDYVRVRGPGEPDTRK